MPEEKTQLNRSHSPQSKGYEDVVSNDTSRVSTHSTPPRPQLKKTRTLTSCKSATKQNPSNNKYIRAVRPSLASQTKTPYCTPIKSSRKMSQKALSMEDLTPSKRILRFESEQPRKIREVKGGTGSSSALVSLSRQQRLAAARVSGVLMLSAWRRRRDEVRCLRKTLEGQASNSERLRVQIFALRSILDGDNKKVRLAIQELERLKSLLADREQEISALHKEKRLLEQNIASADEKSMSLRIELEKSMKELEIEKSQHENTKGIVTRLQRHVGSLRAHLNDVTEKLTRTEEELKGSHVEVAREKAVASKLHQLSLDRQKQLQAALTELDTRSRKIELLEKEQAAILSAAATERSLLKEKVNETTQELERTLATLRVTRSQLDYWPASLTKLMGIARAWSRTSMSLTEAIVWYMNPVRHGC